MTKAFTYDIPALSTDDWMDTVSRVEVLDGLGIETIPGTEFLLTKTISRIFDRSTSSVLEWARHNRDAFEATGYKVLTGSELRRIKAKCDMTGNGGMLTVWTKESVLLMALGIDCEFSTLVRNRLSTQTNAAPDEYTTDSEDLGSLSVLELVKIVNRQLTVIESMVKVLS